MKKNALIFYSRLPTPQLVAKTRIGKEIGDQEVASLFANVLISDLFFEYSNSKDYDFVFYYKGNIDDCKLEKDGVNFIPQLEGGDLSMKYIHEKMFQEYEKVMIVGSDIPFIDGEIIQDCFEKLRKQQCVVVPVMDGGYGLIGMNAFYDLYSTIQNWDSRTSGYNLLSETISLAEKKGLDLHLLSSTFDIDSLRDVQRLWVMIEGGGKLLGEFGYLSRTYEYLKKNSDLFQIDTL